MQNQNNGDHQSGVQGSLTELPDTPGGWIIC